MKNLFATHAGRTVSGQSDPGRKKLNPALSTSYPGGKNLKPKLDTPDSMQHTTDIPLYESFYNGHCHIINIVIEITCISISFIKLTRELPCCHVSSPSQLKGLVLITWQRHGNDNDNEKDIDKDIEKDNDNEKHNDNEKDN